MSRPKTVRDATTVPLDMRATVGRSITRIGRSMGNAAPGHVPGAAGHADEQPDSHEGAPEVVGPQPIGSAVDAGDVLVFHTPTPLRDMWRPSHWLPFLIHLTTRSRWNHAALVIGPDARAIQLMVEATARGVEVNRVDSRADEMRSVRLHYHHNDQDDVLAYATGRVGTKYGFFNAFFCGLRHVFSGAVQIKIGNQVICSELVAESLERAAFNWGKDSALVSPGDLAEHLGLPRR